MRRLFIGMIRWYQREVSPRRPPRCKYFPTCSFYAVEAVERYGAFIGALISVWRILRCNPLSRGGLDPVPKSLPFMRDRNSSRHK